MSPLITTTAVEEDAVVISQDWSIAKLRQHLGGIPPERIRFFPLPGHATVADLERAMVQERRLFEIIDGVLVEKTMGYFESILAGILIQLIRNYLSEHDLGIVLCPDGSLRILPGQVRAPDVSFLSWRHFPGRILPREAFPSVAPDLAIEILSPGNTTAEMDRKLKEYFQAGTQLVWHVAPDPKTVTVYRSPNEHRILTINDEVDGGVVLPGFSFSIRKFFESAGVRGEKP